jgi:carboxypeptidase Q
MTASPSLSGGLTALALAASLGLAGLATVVTLAAPEAASAQTFPTGDPVIQALWNEGMNEENSKLRELGHALIDSIGPRLSGSPGFQQSVEWADNMLAGWGIETRRHEYGTWVSWEGDFIHADLLSPRRRTLEAHILAWSPGTDGPVEGDVVVIPEIPAGEFEGWLQGVEGKFVMISMPEESCRAEHEWRTWGRDGAFDALRAERQRAVTEWNQRLLAFGGQAAVSRALDAAGAAGILTSRWSEGWGVNKIFSAATDGIPSIDLSCEDYGLLYRLAEEVPTVEREAPRMRLNVEARFLGDEAPMFNVIGTIPGTELPDEYVLLSAHLDSWHAASGATDNGTGTILMMEAMRMLKAHYPNPRRTIVVGLWGGEEQGLIGSNAYAEDHPEVIDGLQVAMNQDNGTWRVDYIRMMGFTGAGAHFARWFSAIPNEITDFIELDIPGVPEFGGSDHMAFICRQAPGFRLQSSYPEYRQYTWHTNRDTYDKIVWDDLRNNATLTAMLAYMASEDPERVPRDVRVLPAQTGPQSNWPSCNPARRAWEEGQRR